MGSLKIVFIMVVGDDRVFAHMSFAIAIHIGLATAGGLLECRQRWTM